MSAAFRIVVGLGNPGPKYEKTRHNAGFWLVDEIARRYKLNFVADPRSQSLLAKLDWAGDRVYVLKPMQYMNRSGGSVLALASFYKIEAAEILVAHDELDFPPGVARLKVGGGHGGHNGLRDMVSKLGSSNFVRIRLGVGHPGNRDEVVNYVLDTPPKHDLGLIQDAVSRVVDCFPQIIEGNLEKAMQNLHALNK